MSIKRALSPARVTTNLTGTTKTAVIEEMVQLLIAAGGVKDPTAALNAVLERERKMSTGMGHGIAIPHGKTDAVDDMVVGIGIHAAGVDFDAIDHQPSHIFITTLSPINRSGPHIQFLAEVAQLLKDDQRRAAIRAAKTATEIIDLLTGAK